MTIDRDSAGIRIPPPFIFIGALVAAWCVHKLLSQPDIPLIGHWLTKKLGWFAIVTGFAIIFTALGLFRKSGTAPEPWKASSAVVTEGVYRWTRNPMYLGMALVYAGISLVFDSAVMLLSLLPVAYVIQKEVIEREERYMEAKFGEAYRSYKASVRRWI